MKRIILGGYWFACAAILCAQTPATPPDTTLNNLVHTPGYACSTWGELPCQKFGKGKKTLLLLPGWGFDARVFQGFIEKNLEKYTMYALTLPGYGDTKAYPMPPVESSYGDGNWTNGVLKGLLHLIESEKLQRPVLVAHFAVATHVAMEMAARHSEKLEKVVIVGGPAVFYNAPPYDTMSYSSRVRSVDQYLAPRWFKTVRPETWLQGNFPPTLYALDSLLGRQLFEQANTAPLPVQIRYLCEAWAADFSFYEQVKIPVLALLPDLPARLFAYPGIVYPKWFTNDWHKLAAKNPLIQLKLVEGSGCNVMNEKWEALINLLDAF